MSTFSKFIELYNQGYVNIVTYIPFIFLTVIIAITFGIGAIAVVTVGNEDRKSVSILGLGIMLASGIVFSIFYFMNTTLMKQEINIIEDRQSIVKEVNNRIEQDYTVYMIMIGEDRQLKLEDYWCEYQDTAIHKFIIDDINKTIELH